VSEASFAEARDVMRLPPVILLGLEEISQGITAVRELSEHGVAVHGIARWRTPAAYSRWLIRCYYSPNFDDSRVELVNRIADEIGPAFVIALNEEDSRFIRQAADVGRLRGVRLLVPSIDKLAIVNDKAATYRIACEIGVPVPRTWHPQNADEAAHPPDDLTYPCVLKFADPVKERSALDRHGLPGFKSRYCYSVKELRQVLLRYARIGCYPLVQAFCPGFGVAHMLFMHRGEALLRFRHSRLLEYPPEGGVAAACTSLPIHKDDPLLAKSEQLLNRFGWEGAAMVEYRHDPATGQTALMEINGRFWGSLALAHKAGASFVWMTYSVLGLNQPVAVAPFRVGMECRSVDLEVRRLWIILFHRGAVQNRELRFNRAREVARFLLAFLKPTTRYYLFSWSDPIPCLADATLKAARRIGRLLAFIGRGPARISLSK
jgi:predicted ATP-grasp superfamily ATP-dependent carboligase